MRETRFPRFRWLERGEGEPVVLLHGLMGDMTHWDDVLATLDDVARPIAPALPLFDPDLAEASVRELAEYVLRFLDALDIPRAVVGGNSLGGHVALWLALTQPDRVSGLILTGSSGLFERTFTRGVPHRPSAEYVRDKMIEVFHDPARVTAAYVESVRGLLAVRGSALRVLKVARDARRSSVEERLGEIAVPTLLVWGRDDRITPPEVAARFHTLIPDSDLFFLPQCGHAPMLEQPDAFSAVTRWWLRERAPARAVAETLR